MTTINVSLPDKLKNDADELVSAGFYASFSDLVRHSMRRLMSEHAPDLDEQEIIEDVNASRDELVSGKGQKLTSLKNLR